MSNFQNTSYRRHEGHYNTKGNELSRLENLDSINFWRHERMYKMLNPLFSENSTWLTVGDGLGTDANWLEKQELNVIASDIADSALKKSLASGFIKAYSKINAESIAFADDSHDYVLCKEAYHHFPRPYIALYEMIRVSKKAVILIEPTDIGVEYFPIIALKGLLDRFGPQLINKIWKNRYSFETVGNYVYKISEREIEKVAMGINLPFIAFKGINDYHSYEYDLNQPTSNKKIFSHVKRKIGVRNILSRFGLIPYSLKTAIVFKIRPDDQTLLNLKKEGYKIIELAKNPYI